MPLHPHEDEEICTCGHHREAHDDHGKCMACDCRGYWSPDSAAPPPSGNPCRRWNWTRDELEEIGGK